MTWLYQGVELENIDPKYVAFVYVITNNITGRQYIGLKTTVKSITRQVKGKKKKHKVESDWRTYWSSSLELQRDVAELGQENFTREVLHFCLNKGTANYLEAKAQFDNRVLELPEKYYNGIINCRVSKTHLKLEK